MQRSSGTINIVTHAKISVFKSQNVHFICCLSFSSFPCICDKRFCQKGFQKIFFFSFTGDGATELLLSAGGSYLRHTEKKLFCHSIQTGWWYSGHQLACLSLKLMLLLFICNVCLQKPMAWICYYMTLVQKQSFSWMSLSPGVLSTSSLFVFGWNYASWLKL